MDENRAGATDDELSDEGELPDQSRGPLFRAIAVLVLIAFVLAWIPGVTGGCQAALGGR